MADDGGIIQVAPLGHAGHEQMIFDEEVQRAGRRTVQPQPFRRAPGHLRAGFGVAALFVVFRFADVVQQQREVKQAGPFQTLKQGRVMFIRLVLRLPDPVKLFQADQGVLVGGVLVIKFMLHEAGELAEFGDVFAEQVHLVHRAQNRRDAAAAFEDGQKRLAHVFVVQKIAVHERKLVADELREVGMQLQPVLLRVKKNAHQPARRVPENAVGRGANFPVPKQKTVHRLHRPGAFGQPGAQRSQPVLRRREQGHALFQRARDEKNVPHVRVEVAHEFFDAPARATARRSRGRAPRRVADFCPAHPAGG